MQALFGIGFLGVEESSGAFRFCHDGSDSRLEGLGDNARVAVHPCYHRALELELPSDEPLDVLLKAPFEYGEAPAYTDEIEDLLMARSIELVRRCATIAVGEGQSREFEEWAKDVIEVLFSADLKNIELRPSTDGVMRRDIVASIEAPGGPWKRISTTHHASQAVFEVKNFAQLKPAAYQQVSSYMGSDYGDIGFIIYRGAGPNPDANERGHLAAQKRQQRTIVLLPESLLVRLLKKRTAREIQDKFRKWYDNHLRKWSEPVAEARAKTHRRATSQR